MICHQSVTWEFNPIFGISFRRFIFMPHNMHIMRSSCRKTFMIDINRLAGCQRGQRGCQPYSSRPASKDQEQTLSRMLADSGLLRQLLYGRVIRTSLYLFLFMSNFVRFVWQPYWVAHFRLMFTTGHFYVYSKKNCRQFLSASVKPEYMKREWSPLLENIANVTLL